MMHYPQSSYFQTSFILGEPAGRRDNQRGGAGQLTRDQAGARSQLPLPATMLCCGGKKVTSSWPGL